MTDEPGQAALLALPDYREQLPTIEGAHVRAPWLYVQSREAFRRAEEIRYADANREAQRLWEALWARGCGMLMLIQRQTNSSESNSEIS
jgi:hypothetical protein